MSELFTSIVQKIANYWASIQEEEQQQLDSIRKYAQDAEASMALSKSIYNAIFEKVAEKSQKLAYSCGYGAIHWDDSTWNEWKPTTDGYQPQLIRIGTFQQLSPQTNVRIPALVSVVGSKPLILKTKGIDNEKAIKAVQSILLRLLATVPPGKLRFTFIDPISLGQNAATFMHLADYDSVYITGKAWTESQHIEQRLLDLTEHMETIIQKYLRNQYRNIEEYNQEAGEVAEPYRILVVFDFPTNFTEDSARRLVSVARQGTRCGVHTIIVADTTKPLPYGFTLKELEQNSNIIVSTDIEFVWDTQDLDDCSINLDAPPSEMLTNRIIHNYGREAVNANKVEVAFNRIMPTETDIWCKSTVDGIHIPLGRAGARKIQALSLGVDKTTEHNALIVGRIGSGKSNLLHVIITNGALIYPPDELQFYLVDFKEGVEFQKYAEHALPHARVIAIESQREFGLSVLEGLSQELIRRGESFKKVGVENISNYRNKTGKKLARILLIVDEFHVFFEEDDSVASHSAQLLDHIVRQGRAFGIHVVLGSQTLAGHYTLSRSTSDQMSVRIALQCSEADSRLILGDDNAQARLLSRSGEAIYNNANGLLEGNAFCQVAFLPIQEREQRLAFMKNLALAKGYATILAQPIIFAGNEPAYIESNIFLNKLTLSSSWPKPGGIVRAWLGTPVSIKDSTSVFFKRQAGSNLLIVGRSERMATGQFAAVISSIGLQADPSRAVFYILNLMPEDNEESKLIRALASFLPHNVVYGKGRQAEAVIDSIKEELDRRLQNEEIATDKDRLVFFIIYGIQKAKELQLDDRYSHRYGEEPSQSTADKFDSILREGASVGVHIVAWCDSYNNLTKVLERKQLREFELKVVYHLSPDDSSNLIDTPLAHRLKPNLAFLSNEGDGTFEKHKPYDLPCQEWLEEIKNSFSHRKG